MFVQHSTRYKDVPSWGLSDSFWERIKPFIPKPKSRLRGRGKYRHHIGGRPKSNPTTLVHSSGKWNCVFLQLLDYGGDSFCIVKARQAIMPRPFFLHIPKH